MKFLANRKSFFRKISNLKLPARVLFIISVMTIVCGFSLLLFEAGFIYRKTENLLEKERRIQSNQAEIPFEKILLTPHLDKNVRFLQNTKNVKSLARFQDSIFAATDGGLLQLNENGEILRHFTVLDGLPESDLTSLAVFGSKLFIGTMSKGLINFDGENFELFRLKNHETKSITTLLSDSRTLFIGTFSGGLLEFDGKKIVEIKAVEQRIEHITFLQNDSTRFLAGTFDNGLWIRQSGIWKHLTTAEGLLSNRIVGAEISGENLFVATDLGISQAFLNELFQENQKIFRQSATLPTLSSLIAQNNRIFLTKDNGEIFAFSQNNKFLDASKLQAIAWNRPKNQQNAHFFKLDDEIWFLSKQGVWKNSENNSNNFALSAFGNFSDENELTENTVSAMTIDASGRLWIGTFRSGIDVFSANGKKLKHLESETIREINFLLQDAENKTVSAAASGGVVSFDAAFNASVSKDKLPSRSITQISFAKNGKKSVSAFATAKGLWLNENNSSRIFSPVNGLPSNNIFTTLFARDALFVGTLGGLAQIENGKIARVFKTSNSELKNNWINALCLADNRIFIGTYGGGVFELLASGEIRSFANETGNVFVNQNAIFSDEERLYVGTLEGIWRLDLTTQKWSQIKDVLPAETVLSITGNRESIFVGTTNGIAQINKNFWSENKL